MGLPKKVEKYDHVIEIYNNSFDERLIEENIHFKKLKKRNNKIIIMVISLVFSSLFLLCLNMYLTMNNNQKLLKEDIKLLQVEKNAVQTYFMFSEKYNNRKYSQLDVIKEYEEYLSHQRKFLKTRLESKELTETNQDIERVKYLITRELNHMDFFEKMFKDDFKELTKEDVKYLLKKSI